MFFNVFLSIGVEVVNKLQGKMSENAADNDPLVEVFDNVESADERIKNVLSSIGSSLLKTFEEYTVRRDKLVKSA